MNPPMDRDQLRISDLHAFTASRTSFTVSIWWLAAASW